MYLTSTWSFFSATLVLAGMQWRFFVVACMLLWLSFVAKTLLVTCWSFGYFWTELHSIKAFSLLPSSLFPTKLVGSGLATSWEGAQEGQWTQTDCRSIPYHVMVCSARKSHGMEEEGRHSWWWHFSSQATITSAEVLLSRKWLDICLLMGSTELIPLFDLLVRAAFAVPLNCYYLDPQIFAPSFFLLPTLRKKGASERLSRCLAAGWGPPTIPKKETVVEHPAMSSTFLKELFNCYPVTSILSLLFPPLQVLCSCFLCFLSYSLWSLSFPSNTSLQLAWHLSSSISFTPSVFSLPFPVFLSGLLKFTVSLLAPCFKLFCRQTSFPRRHSEEHQDRKGNSFLVQEFYLSVVGQCSGWESPFPVCLWAAMSSLI